MRMALAMPSLMPRESRSVLVTNRSSPTSWMRLADAVVDAFFVAGLVDARGDGFQTDLEGLFIRFAAWREAAFVAEGGGVAVLFQRGLESVEDFDAPAQRLRKARRPDRHNHEFLEVHGTVGMRAAVKNVHHGTRQEICRRIGGISRKIFVERLLKGDSSCTGGGHGDGENGVGAEAGLGGGAVERNHFVVEGSLGSGADTAVALADFGLALGDTLEHPLLYHFCLSPFANLP